MEGYVDITLTNENGKTLYRHEGHNTITKAHIQYINDVCFRSNSIPNHNDRLENTSPCFPMYKSLFGSLMLFSDNMEFDNPSSGYLYPNNKIFDSYLVGADEAAWVDGLEDPTFHEGILISTSKTSNRITKTWKFGKGVYGDIGSLGLGPLRNPFMSVYDEPYTLSTITPLFYDDQNGVGYEVNTTDTTNYIRVYRMQCANADSYGTRFVSNPAKTLVGSQRIDGLSAYGDFRLDLLDGDYNTSRWTAHACKIVDDRTISVIRVHYDDDDGLSFNTFSIDLSANDNLCLTNLYYFKNPIINNGYLYYPAHIESPDGYEKWMLCFSEINYDDYTIIDDLYDQQFLYTGYAPVFTLNGGIAVCGSIDDETRWIYYSSTPVKDGVVQRRIDYPNGPTPASIRSTTKLYPFKPLIYGNGVVAHNRFLSTAYDLGSIIHKGQNQILTVAYTLSV